MSFSSPAIHVVSVRRASATRLEVDLAVNRKATPGGASLYVSNPASAAAEATFTISAPAAPPAAPAPPPGAAHKPTGNAPPEVTEINPPRATQGGTMNLKIKGKYFAPGLKVSFSNPGIRVLETKALNSSELEARVVVANDAPCGKTGLFVVNPDDSEVEVPYEVTAEKPTAPAQGEKSAAQAPLTFEVLNLADGVSILQDPNKAKGKLTLAGGKFKYEEGGRDIFSVASNEVKEIDINIILGVNTGTFHVILNSGKTYNFVAASLRAGDTRSMVESLRRAIH